jgi:hypothetical protein
MKKLSSQNSQKLDKPETGIITFGKHAGKRVADLPDCYLDWLGTIAIRNPGLKDAIVHELEKRQTEFLENFGRWSAE